MYLPSQNQLSDSAKDLQSFAGIIYSKGIGELRELANCIPGNENGVKQDNENVFFVHKDQRCNEPYEYG